jgi:hypothetical protein
MRGSSCLTGFFSGRSAGSLALESAVNSIWGDGFRTVSLHDAVAQH